MINTTHLRKEFGSFIAVEDISLNIESGETYGFLGPNGAGKTTLFNLVTGFHKPDGGEILFKGERIDGLPPHKIFRRKICRTFQITREFGHMTVLENLMLVPGNQRGEWIFNTWFRPGLVKKQEREIRDKALEV